MKRKEVTVELRVKLVLSLEADQEAEDVVNDMEYSFVPQTPGVSVTDTEILDMDEGGAESSDGVPVLAGMVDEDEQD